MKLRCCCGNKEPTELDCVEVCNKASRTKAKKLSAVPRVKKLEKSIRSNKSQVEEPSRHNIYLSKIFEHPVPYTFRVPARLSPAPHVTTTRARPAKSPPFYLLLDHMIAVIWCLFSPDKDDKIKLGISQLQWALYFLRGTKMSNGDYRPDVSIAIRAIEDSLIESYADMSCVVMQTPTVTPSCITCDLQRILPQTRCNICSSIHMGVTPHRSFRTIPSNFDGSLYGTYRTPRDTEKRPFPLQASAFDTSEHVKADIIRLKELAATMSKEQMVTNYEQDAIMDHLHEWHQEKIGKLKEEIEELRKTDKSIQ